MPTYYEILGLNKTATLVEIKTAFRRLAKIYHPDKNPNNPNAKLMFENILTAYDALSNPTSKRRYDYNINSSSPQPSNKVNYNYTKQKNTPTAEELKQREYYKNYYNAKKKTVVQNKTTIPYNDYKYILFATPIAVGLLLLIISFFTETPITQTQLVKPEIQNSIQPIDNQIMKNGDKPFEFYYGNQQTFSTTNNLKINNSTNYDAIIVVFNLQTKEYMQQAYVQKGYLVEFNFLPNSGVYWKCMIGNTWDATKTYDFCDVLGGFDSVIQYQNWEQKPLFFKNESVETIELLNIINGNSINSKYISNPKDFFQK